MTPDLTPQPAPDERTETVARAIFDSADHQSLTPRRHMTWDIALASPLHWATSVERARAQAAAVIAALDDETARLRAEVERFKRVAESERAYAGHIASRSVPLIEAYKAERDAARAEVEQLRPRSVAEANTTLADRNGWRTRAVNAEAALDRVWAVVTDWGAGTVHRPRSPYYTRLRAALDPEEPR